VEVQAKLRLRSPTWLCKPGHAPERIGPRSHAQGSVVHQNYDPDDPEAPCRRLNSRQISINLDRRSLIAMPLGSTEAIADACPTTSWLWRPNPKSLQRASQGPRCVFGLPHAQRVRSRVCATRARVSRAIVIAQDSSLSSLRQITRVKRYIRRSGSYEKPRRGESSMIRKPGQKLRR
jgi:hypothetical protein